MRQTGWEGGVLQEDKRETVSVRQRQPDAKGEWEGDRWGHRKAQRERVNVIQEKTEDDRWEETHWKDMRQAEWTGGIVEEDKDGRQVSRDIVRRFRQAPHLVMTCIQYDEK